MSTLAPPRPGAGSMGTQVVYLTWDQYLDWLTGKLRRVRTSYGWVELGPAWAPGQHMALIGPTGDGKTTHAVGVLGTRSYVMSLDPKGEDDTLSESGYTRLRALPERSLRGQVRRFLEEDQRAWRQIERDIEAGLPARLILGGASRTDEEDRALQQLMREAITYCRHSGGWTLYVDEFELFSSQRMMKLGDLVERMLITARRDKTSVVTAYQAQAWVSKHATRQARLAVVWPTGDRDMIKAIAQAMGRDPKAVEAAIDELPPFHTVTLPRGPRGGPFVITSAPALAA